MKAIFLIAFVFAAVAAAHTADPEVVTLQWYGVVRNRFLLPPSHAGPGRGTNNTTSLSFPLENVTMMIRCADLVVRCSAAAVALEGCLPSPFVLARSVVTVLRGIDYPSPDQRARVRLSITMHDVFFISTAFPFLAAVVASLKRFPHQPRLPALQPVRLHSFFHAPAPRIWENSNFG